ncbi:MAG: GGDEF domain-containing protein [Pseudomonadaceae bacterium]|nr:MAG: GGDEF domain-containing protein [Pseudomonadaceae bacterium]
MEMSALAGSPLTAPGAVFLVFFLIISLVYNRILVGRLKTRDGKIQALQGKLDEVSKATHHDNQTDPLTGLWNRWRLSDKADAELKRCRRHGVPLSILAIELDQFNDINQNHGHQVSDEVLRSFSKLLSTTIRQSDLVCRWSAGKFLMLLPHTDLKQGSELAEKLRRLTAESNLLVDDAISISVGIASLQSEEDFNSLVTRSEMALGEAQRRGRDRSQGCLTELQHQETVSPS